MSHKPAKVSEPRGGRVYSKLDCNLPATVTADPLSLRPSPPCTLPFTSLLLLSLCPFLLFSIPLLSLSPLPPSLFQNLLSSVPSLLLYLPPFLRPSPPSTVTFTSLPPSHSPSLASPYSPSPLYLLPSLLFHLFPLRLVIVWECVRPVTKMHGFNSVLLLL